MVVHPDVLNPMYYTSELKTSPYSLPKDILERNSTEIPNSYVLEEYNTELRVMNTPSKPYASTLHFIFKILSCIIYYFGSFIFGGWNGDYVFSFVFTVVLVSIDFWVVKNLTGRLLVGMRWWNEVNEDGSNEWKFECSSGYDSIQQSNKNFFWTILWLWTLFWLLSLFTAILRIHFEWILVIIISLCLAIANLYGYWKCSKSIKKKEQWAVISSVTSLLNRFL